MRHVWIVDDDEEMSHAIGLMLNLLDCDTTSFFNVRSAVQRLLTGKIPDLIILDINLPEVSGLDMLEFLRRRPEWKNLPIVILSSEAADVVVDRAFELGADSYVMKPVTIEELEKAMSAALSNHVKL
ncbi:MAG TPA: response regulator [Anaerolineales bacterium]|jgi:DNA-binding response OmpR family regulator|nr:response regulator [Anaerolineales bacterium]